MVTVKVRDGQGIHLVQMEIELRSVVGQGRTSRAKPDIKEHRAQVRFDQIGHAGIAQESFPGFPLYQHRQFQELEFGQIKELCLARAFPVKLSGPAAILLEAAVSGEQQRDGDRR
jgi:hypothetical protein